MQKPLHHKLGTKHAFGFLIPIELTESLLLQLFSESEQAIKASQF